MAEHYKQILLALDFLENDELLEVTPKSLRLRKKILNHDQRGKKNKKNS